MTMSTVSMLMRRCSGTCSLANVLVKRNFSFGIPGLDNDKRHNVEHTPLFCKEVLKYADPAGEKVFLDMTFGSGGHSSLILDHCPEAKVIASDCCSMAFQEAKERASRYTPGALVPLRARFSQLPDDLIKLGIAPSSLDGIIIDTGCSAFQWMDRTRGFCHTRKGTLDLRMDSDLSPHLPTGSQVLQMTNEHDLWKLLRNYSGMKSRAKHVTNAIIEARYMFHQFQTVQELYSVLRPAAKKIALQEGLLEEEVAYTLIKETVLALRMFVNNEINELDFALRVVSENFIRPGGVLIIIAHSRPESKVIFNVLEEVVIPTRSRGTIKLSQKDMDNLGDRPWKMVLDEPMPLSTAEKTLHPRFESAFLYIAEKTDYYRDRIIL